VATRNYENVRIYGGMTSGVFLGPLGATLPTTDLIIPAELDAVGWLSEDGIGLSVEANVEKFRGYPGGSVLRTKVTSTDKSVAIQALEESPLVTGLFFDHGAPVAAGTDLARVDLPELIGTVARSGVLAFEDGDVTKLIVCPRLEVTNRGTVAHQSNDMTVYELGLEIIGDSYMLTNSEAFVNAIEPVTP
jgi:hypothetical protein